MDTIATRIKQGLSIRNMRQTDLVIATGIGKSSISTYISGEYEPKQRNIYKIAKALNVSEAWLMGYDVPMDRATLSDSAALPSNILPLPKTYKVPLLGNIACGEPILAVENIETQVDAPEDVKCDFALRCKGDSMINARIFDGDIVYIRQQPNVENGEIAAVLVDGTETEATLKRVQTYEDHVVLEPENPMYKPFVYWGNDMNRVRILGKAVAFTSAVR